MTINSGKIVDGRLLFHSENEAIEAPTRKERRGVNTYQFFKRITKAVGVAFDVEIEGVVHTVNKKSLAQYLVRISTDAPTSKKTNTVALEAFERVAQGTNQEGGETKKRGVVLNRYVNQTNKREKLTAHELSSSKRWEQNFKGPTMSAPRYEGGYTSPVLETISIASSGDSGIVVSTLDDRIVFALEQLNGLRGSPALATLKEEYKKELLDQLQALQKLQLTFKELGASEEVKALKTAQAQSRTLEKELQALTNDKILYTTLLDQVNGARDRLERAQIEQAKAEEKLKGSKLTNFVRTKAEKLEQSQVVDTLKEKVAEFDLDLKSSFSAFQRLLDKYRSTEGNFLSEIERLSLEMDRKLQASKANEALKEAALNQLKGDTVFALKQSGISLVADFVTERFGVLKGFDRVKEEFDYSIKANQFYFACLEGLRSTNRLESKASVEKVKKALTQLGNPLIAKGAKIFSSKEETPKMLRRHEALFEVEAV